MDKKKRGGIKKSREIGRDFYVKSSFISTSQSDDSEEIFLLKLLKETSQRLKTKYNYSDEQLFAVCTREEQTITIPLSIFADELCPSEALTKYLKEEHQLTYHEISVLINRDERGVWANYQRAIKKQHASLEIVEGISVPVSIFQNNKLSILECLISFLKEVLHLKNSKIAKLLNRNQSNIWTIYKRAKNKEVKK